MIRPLAAVSLALLLASCRSATAPSVNAAPDSRLLTLQSPVLRDGRYSVVGGETVITLWARPETVRDLGATWTFRIYNDRRASEETLIYSPGYGYSYFGNNDDFHVFIATPDSLPVGTHNEYPQGYGRMSAHGAVIQITVSEAVYGHPTRGDILGPGGSGILGSFTVESPEHSPHGPQRLPA